MLRKACAACCCSWLASLVAPETWREIISVPIATVIVIRPMVRPTSSSIMVMPCWARLGEEEGVWRMASVRADDLRRARGAIGQAARAGLDVLHMAAARGGAAGAARGTAGRLQPSGCGAFVFAPADHHAQLPAVRGVALAGHEEHPGVTLRQ